MYVGIDIGGTKTLVAVLNENGVIHEKIKFPTNPNYSEFLLDLKKAINSLGMHDFKAGAVAVTGPRTDRKHGRIVNSSNLPWRNVPIQHDAELLCGCPLVIENDAKLAALSESMLLKDKYKKVLYVTVSTGIGFGLVVNGVIDTSVGDAGGKPMLLEHKGKLVSWEDFASGHAIVERFGKQAKDINDQQTWKIISRDLAKGFIHLIAIMQPDVIVIGGGVGNYFEKFEIYLKEDIENYKIPLVKLPKMIKAQRPDDAVIYGCYDIAKQHFNHEKYHN